MTRDEVLAICAGRPGAVEDYPFGEGVAVFKVGARMFALIPLEGDPVSLSLKCDPDLALELRTQYRSVRSGYHLNKRHWNTVELDGSVEDVELRWMIDHSYELVLANLPRAVRDQLHGGSRDHRGPLLMMSSYFSRPAGRGKWVLSYIP